jgi:hypothetical protein
MNKQLKKKVEQKLIQSMEAVLSEINTIASSRVKKKIKEAGKMVAKKFLKTISDSGVTVASKNGGVKKKSKKGIRKPGRDASGKFSRKKK